MHRLPRKVLETYLYLQECHLKQKAESEVEICLKELLNFVRFCLGGILSCALKRISVKVNKLSSFYCMKLEEKHN